MGVTTLHRLDQLVDDVLRRRLVRIAHAEVDNIFTAAARCHFELAHLVENIRWQALDTREFFGQGDYTAGLRLRDGRDSGRPHATGLKFACQTT
jgi:hypothetical protein